MQYLHSFSHNNAIYSIRHCVLHYNCLFNPSLNGQHFAILLKYVIHVAIPDIPSWVGEEMAKLEFQRREAFKVKSCSFFQCISDSGCCPSTHWMTTDITDAISDTSMSLHTLSCSQTWPAPSSVNHERTQLKYL